MPLNGLTNTAHSQNGLLPTGSDTTPGAQNAEEFSPKFSKSLAKQTTSIVQSEATHDLGSTQYIPTDDDTDLQSNELAAATDTQFVTPVDSGRITEPQTDTTLVNNTLQDAAQFFEQEIFESLSYATTTPAESADPAVLSSEAATDFYQDDHTEQVSGIEIPHAFIQSLSQSSAKSATETVQSDQSETTSTLLPTPPNLFIDQADLTLSDQSISARQDIENIAHELPQPAQPTLQNPTTESVTVNQVDVTARSTATLQNVSTTQTGYTLADNQATGLVNPIHTSQQTIESISAVQTTLPIQTANESVAGQLPERSKQLETKSTTTTAVSRNSIVDTSTTPQPNLLPQHAHNSASQPPWQQSPFQQPPVSSGSAISGNHLLNNTAVASESITQITGNPVIAESIATAESELAATPASPQNSETHNTNLLSAGKTETTSIDLSVNAAATKSQPSGTADLQAERVELVTRISQAMQTAQQTGRQISVRLRPAELGTIQIDVTLHEGSLSAQLQVESETTQRIIMENLPALQEALAQSGNTIDRIDVQWNQQQSEEQQPREQHSHSHERNPKQQQEENRQKQDDPDTFESELAEKTELDQLDIQL